MKTIVIDPEHIQRILQRIAYQIVEQCHNESEVLLVGILPRGKWVSERLAENLAGLTEMQCKVEALDLDDNEAMQSLSSLARGSCVIIADDILNTGSTMMRAATWAMQAGAKRIITACLVDRRHRMFPIKSDFTGLSLATTIQEHLVLDVSDQPVIYLQ